MARKKEMTVENATEMQKKETALRNEVKLAQKKKTTKGGKENGCGFREHRKVHQKNSSDKFRPTCKKTYISYNIKMWMFMIIS